MDRDIKKYLSHEARVHFLHIADQQSAAIENGVDLLEDAVEVSGKELFNQICCEHGLDPDYLN